MNSPTFFDELLNEARARSVQLRQLQSPHEGLVTPLGASDKETTKKEGRAERPRTSSHQGVVTITSAANRCTDGSRFRATSR